jgi:hypothetical protein
VPYPEPTDADYDATLQARHRAAVADCDRLLARFADREADQVRQRSQWERDADFDFQLDFRLAYVASRLATAPHPFEPPEAKVHLDRLLDYMLTVPRLTAPIVAPDHAAEYRRVRASALKTFGVN